MYPEKRKVYILSVVEKKLFLLMFIIIKNFFTLS